MKRGADIELGAKPGEAAHAPEPDETELEAEAEEDATLLPSVEELVHPPWTLCRALGARRLGNTFVFRNKMTVGPHWPGLLFTNVLVVFSTGMFIKDIASGFSSVHVGVSLTLCGLTLLFLNKTGLTDPGTVRVSAEESLDNRYCDVCQIYTTRDVEHCEDCDLCCAELDHHCPWMSKCVGRDNMRWFVLFNVTWISYLIYVLAMWMEARWFSRRHH